MVLKLSAFFTERDFYTIMYQHHISVWTRTNLSPTTIQHRPQCLGASSEVNLRISMTILQTIFRPIGSDTDSQGTYNKQTISLRGRGAGRSLQFYKNEQIILITYASHTVWALLLLHSNKGSHSAPWCVAKKLIWHFSCGKRNLTYLNLHIARSTKTTPTNTFL